LADKRSMIGRVLVAVALLLSLTPNGRAQRGADCPAAVPVVPLPPVTLYRGQPALPPVEVPPEVRPGILLYRREASPPLVGECPPRPPIHLFECARPPVTFFRGESPGVELIRARPQPPAPPCDLPPRQPVTLFRVTAESPRCGPAVVAPPVTILRQPGPGCEGPRP
jgi:hypothetical protein